ncbi:MAG: fused MFS/spermidine synthase [bacterium]|nr:fused MFS/spermidine synthase [bacterium]
MNAKIRSLTFSFLIYLAFFASGAGCLAAEVTWNRMLIVVVGNSLSAAAMIIIIFMGGLGLGSVLGGRYFSRRRGSLMPYVLLEACIGLYVMASPALFDLLTGLFTSMAAGTAQQGSLTAARLLVSTVALLLPAILMGATFPAMIAGTTEGDAGRRSARTSYLYSVNTIGAALGCFAAGYYFLLERGVQATIMVALGLYVTAALSALIARGLRPQAVRTSSPQPDVVEQAGIDEAEGVPARVLRAATFGIGFVALAYEVLLTRLSILYLGNTVSVFPLVLTAFLLGTGFSAVAGTWLYGVLGRVRGLRMFGLLALGAGVFVMATPYLLLSGAVRGVDQLTGMAGGATRDPLPILGILILPTILIGALLPVAMRMLPIASGGGTTRSAANLYALNTAGGVIGAGVANHLLVPHIGVQNTLLLLTAVCVAIGLLVLLPRRRLVISLGAAAVVVAALALVLPGVMDLYARRIAEDTGAAKTEMLLVREGRAATVTVLDQTDPRKGTYRDMYLNGIEEASTRYWHVQLFKLLGVLPGLLHEGEGDMQAAVVAFGAGITAGSVLALDDVASLDVVDLNPDIEGINDLFTEVNGDVFHDPRFHFHNDDGRNFLVTSRKQYDLVISDSTHPRAYDSWILYTQEFYASVRQRLAPGGIFAQWVPVLDSMRGPLFSIHLNTFRTVFPHTTLWLVPGSDQALLLAMPGPLAVDAGRLQARLDRLPDWFSAAEYRLDTVERLAAFFWLDEAAMSRLIGSETRINTDGRHYFDSQAALIPAPPELQLPYFQADAASCFTSLADGQRQAIADEQLVAFHMGHFAYFHRNRALFRAWCLDQANANTLYWVDLALGGEQPDPKVLCASDGDAPSP